MLRSGVRVPIGVQNHYQYLKKCKYCEQEFDTTDKPSGWMANHVRWCDKNPKDYSKSSALATTAMLKARKNSNFLNQFSKAKQLGQNIPESKVKGRSLPGTPHTDEMKHHLSEKALQSNHRRLRKNPILYNGILLDSTWELELAKRLDSLNIKWVRPDPIPWEYDGIKHNYFPDFYLPEYDVYLDPKNSQAVKVQKKKLEILTLLYPNIVILETLKECKEYSPSCGS